MTYSQEEQKILLDLAFKAIEAKFAGNNLSKPSGISPALLDKRGAFVTLKKRGRLRGCIGYIEGKKPLWEAVVELAQASAFRDHRFPPLTKDELKDISFEISVLTPLKQIKDVEEVIVGKHGLYLKRGLNAGLLLPQVAVEHKWDRETFLSETCRKAGLPPDAWRDPQTQKYCFSADIFPSKRHRD